MATAVERKWRRKQITIRELKLVSWVYLQLRGLVLGELAGLLVGRVQLGPAVLGAVPVDVRCKRGTLANKKKDRERKGPSIIPTSTRIRGICLAESI